MNSFAENKRSPYFAGLCLIFSAAQTGWAQFPSLRVTDTRTIIPQVMIADRKDWGADLGFGGSFNRGNADVDYFNTSADLFKTWSSGTAYLNGALLYNTFNGLRILNQGAMTERFDREISGPWKIFVFNTNAYNEFVKLNYRATTGVGPWLDFSWEGIKTGASLAIVYEYENYQGGVYNRDGRISFRDIATIPISEVAAISTDFFYIPRVDRSADYRLFGEIALQSMIWKQYLGLKLSWTDEYNNRPQPGIKPNDTIWLTSLTLHFGK